MTDQEHFTKRFPSQRPIMDDGKDFPREALSYYNHVQSRLSRFESLGGHRQETTPEKVSAIYDTERMDLWEEIDAWPYDRLVYGNGSEDDFVLYNGLVRWGRTRAVLEFLYGNLRETLTQYMHPDGMVLEIGCGAGRNLFFLKKTYPNINFIGVDISPVSINVARELSRLYRLPVEFQCLDITTKDPKLDSRADAVFTHHALEGMPRIYPLALNAMARLAPKAIVMFEPVVELWGDDELGQASKLRVKTLDRMTGLFTMLDEERNNTSTPYSIPIAKALGYSVNPLNETCLIVMELKPRP